MLQVTCNIYKSSHFQTYRAPIQESGYCTELLYDSSSLFQISRQFFCKHCHQHTTTITMSTATKEEETHYQLASEKTEAAVFVSDEQTDGSSVHKQGHKFCGCCCDVRSAVIAVNLVNIGILLLSCLSESVSGAMYGVVGGLIVSSAIGVAGAVRFNKWMVGVAASAYILGIAGALVSLHPQGLIYRGLFLYPHLYLIKEIHCSTMTKENYEPIEKFCYC